LLGVSERSPHVDLVGHSFGGWLASKVASAAPTLVRKVVLLAPGGLGRSGRRNADGARGRLRVGWGTHDCLSTA
jgi:pimeloyl-ACP methyl ester carboxylesterase